VKLQHAKKAYRRFLFTQVWSMVIEEMIVGQQGIDERKRLGNLG
jgi:hypothetical protein